MAILISNKVDFRAKKITRDRKGHYVMMKGSIHQADITILNVYTPDRVAKYVKQNPTKQKGEIDKSTMIAGDFNTSFSLNK